ncbi:hypothetical protein [Maribacter sp. Asnod1-A12]|uniref:hypothetical protein n=1 Tax=Maribacter sp. Asnod1-A12 TaxID=3160576 RepID=UPI00386BBA0F
MKENTKSYNINIWGFNNPVEFIIKWSPLYSYPNEFKYNKIYDVLENKDSFIELFKWKNGTGDKISQKKMRVVLGFWEKIDVLRELSNSFRYEKYFDWELFENEFQPNKNSPIWTIFLLHLINRYEFPIFDQHVYRSYNFFKNGVIGELPLSSKKVYQIYKTEYKNWFNEIHENYDIVPKEMDESLFTFGRMLKGLKGYPIDIYS